jgi:uncharacterized protein YrzB (UPF0473 family)
MFSGNIKAQYEMVNEFYKNQGIETLYKGIYLGKTAKNDKEFFKFQFHGVLKGENRFFEVLFETNTDKKASKTVLFNETDKPEKSNLSAYLLYCSKDESRKDLSYKLKNEQHDEYDFSKLPQSPDAFFKSANAENEKRTDTVFVVSIHAGKYGNWFPTELLLWIKTEDGKYLPERYKTSINGSREGFNIKITV